MMRKTSAGFNVADFRSRWIQYFFPKCRLLASSGAECLPWCSFRCPCLDELGSKSDCQYPVPFLLQNVCILSFSDCEARG